MTEIDTAIVYTEDVDALAAFYRAAFLLDPPEEFGPDHRGLRVGGTYLGFDRVEGASPGAVSLWFRVDDLEATFDRIVALGAQVRYPPTEKPWGDVLAAVHDPDGNLLGLAQRRE